MSKSISGSFVLGLAGFSVVLTLGLTSCQKGQNLSDHSRTPALVPLSDQVSEPVLSQTQGEKPSIPSIQGPEVKTPESKTAQPSRVLTLSDQTEITLLNIAGKYFFEVEATYAPKTFAILASRGAVQVQLDDVLAQLKKIGAISSFRADAVGYFTFYLPYRPELFSDIKKIELRTALYFAPVTLNRDAVKDAKKITPASEGLSLKTLETTEKYSGLSRINALRFVKRAEADIGGGVKVNGSSARLGITDTGITYHHPTFYSGIEPKINRIEYMRDFTKEGRVYFSPSATFVVKQASELPPGLQEDELLIDAQWIETPKLPALPMADQLKTELGLRIKVSAELRAKLLAPDVKAKLGALLETALSSEEEKTDINGNGKIDDRMWMLLIEGATPDQDAVYLDQRGNGDFRGSPAFRDWTSSKVLMQLYAEKVGFEVGSDILPTTDPANPVKNVKFASIVGYDPGNHGSHVAGIAGGSRTIANDQPDSLARGVAPEAVLLMNRVCSNSAGCNASKAIINLALEGKSDVINMSLGGLGPNNDGYGVQETIINRLVALQNVQMVISAGNSGPGRQTIGSPSVAQYSLSVGASATKGLIQKQYQWPQLGMASHSRELFGFDGESKIESDADQDFMLFFSSRGPTAAGGFKPNLVAPGTELSSIQLNAAPGAGGGVAVYWGTSMSAPTATGAYALFLDAIRKYNLRHPETKLSTQAMLLREVLIQSAQPFDVNRFDPETSTKTKGQYTWVDQGTGMLDLDAAWTKLFEIRDRELEQVVKLQNGTPVRLEYFPLIAMKSPTGVAYDGTKPGNKDMPAFGTGIYLDPLGTETLVNVHIARRLPEFYLMDAEAGELIRQVRTTREEFVLKTVYYGADQEWLRVGTQDSVDCWNSPTRDLTVLSEGVQVAVKPDGTGALVPLGASQLNVCINRRAFKSGGLTPGDHGALIYAYRKEGAKVSPLASFIVPVYITVPHQTLDHGQAYDVSGEVKSFGVQRNYVLIPKGTTVVHMTIETPELKLGANGLMAEGEHCSGVEIMGLEGSNVTALMKSRKEARVSNCDGQGRPQNDKRVIKITRNNPTPGIWDLHFFGQYRFPKSNYHFRVDFVVGSTTVSSISGSLEALKGTLEWNQKDGSLSAVPSKVDSIYELDGVLSETEMKATEGAMVYVESALGVLRKYPEGLRSVKVTTGASEGNDLDFAVFECNLAALTPQDPSCKSIGQSAGPTDQEELSFTPKVDRAYTVQVAGYDIKNDGKFLATETLFFKDKDLGLVELLDVSSVPVLFGSESKSSVSQKIGFSFSEEVLQKSKIIGSEWVQSSKSYVVGRLNLVTTQGITLLSVPVKVKK